MSSVALVLEFDGLAPAAAVFGALRETGEDLRPVLDDVGAELESSTLMRFETNVAPDGTPWIPSHRARATGGVTLVEEGHLRDSVHYRVDGADAVEIGAGGIAAAYAAVHQTGFDGTVEVAAHERRFTMVFGRPLAGKASVKAHQRKMHLPARPYLGISAEDGEAIGEILVEHYQAAVVRGLG